MKYYHDAQVKAVYETKENAQLKYDEIQYELDKKADAEHNHDNLYYTQGQIDSQMSQVVFINIEDNEDVADVNESVFKDIIFTWEVDEETGEEYNHKLEYGDIVITEFLSSSNSYSVQIGYEEHANLTSFMKKNLIRFIKNDLTSGYYQVATCFTISDGFIDFNNFEILNPDHEL